MRMLLVTISFAGCLVLGSVTPAQQNDGSSGARRARSIPVERLRVDPGIQLRDLTSTRPRPGSDPAFEAKMRVLSERLRVSPGRIGLSEPLVMDVAGFELHVPGKTWVTVRGGVDLQPRERRFGLKRNTSFYLYFQPSTMAAGDLFLVTARIRAARRGRMSTVHTVQRRRDVGLESVEPGISDLHFVIESDGRRDRFVQLFADFDWSLERIEITPVTRR